MTDAELRRDSAAIGAELLSSRDVLVRRSAARALARIADARASESLLLALADEDPEVTTWAAYGLGYTCSGREAKTVRALVARAASLPPGAPSAPLWSPLEAISDALGRCAANDAESTLRGWLRGPKARAEAAALALGRVAEHAGKLSDQTLVAVLDAADQPQTPLENAFFPLTRLTLLNPSSAERARVLALGSITSHAPGAEFALRALAKTGPAGASALGSLLADAQLAPGLRAQAARELGSLAAAGQRPLWAAFDALFTQAPSERDLSQENYGPLSALLDALRPPILGSGDKLRGLAELAVAEFDSSSLKRRKYRLRCMAGALLAGSNFQSPRLLACDPTDESRARELAVLHVIGREKLRGARKQAYLKRARASDALLREAALDELAEHAELDEAYQVLAEALVAKPLGVVASAARVLASYPERAARAAGPSDAARSAPNPDPSVVKALTQAHAEARARSNIEVQSLLLDAASALQILSLKEAMNAACSSDNKTLREHAERALRLLGEQARQCDVFQPQISDSVTRPKAQRVSIVFETEVGTLTLALDSRLAPNAVGRVLGLVNSGFYDGMAVHRVVPGFVAQFGDPSGDGYGGDDQPPLRCETSPLPFRIGSVGVALSGRDTGSSQLFVTLGRYPHLDGQYAWLGEAGPGWDRLAAGDRILRARVSSSP